jgi:ubiquinol-cytochrome c reductase cytochrome b subunit
MYIAHVLIFPLLLATLIGVHLALIAARHHTQFRESERTTEKRIVGSPMFPAQLPRSLGLMFFTVGILFLLGGLVQINPIWQWGPYEPWIGTNGAQPDWYLGWLIGALRLMPSFDVTIGHFTLVPNPFWGGILFPGLVFGLLGVFPWLERRLARDTAVHNLADRPRDAPLRTAFGAALLGLISVVFLFGAADRVFVLWGLNYTTQLTLFRIALVVVPVLLFFVARGACRHLVATERVEADREAAEGEAREHERGLLARAPGGEPDASR